MGQEDVPGGVRDVLRPVVDSPFDFLGLSDVPHSGLVGSKELGGPDIPGDKVDRGGEDGRSGEEQNSQSGREFHCERRVWFREKRGRWSMVEKVGKP